MPISSGLPQGGVLSPCPWDIVFNDMIFNLRELRISQNVPISTFLDLIYADDFTTLIISPELRLLRRYAAQNLPNMEKVVGLKYLNLSMP